MSVMKYSGRAIFVPAMFMLGACCCSNKDVVVAPAAPPAKPAVAAAATVSAPLIQDIYFDFDRSAITSTAQPDLKTNAGWLAANTGRGLVVEGHCDERGTSEYNMALGDRRATAAKEYLVRLGVDASRLQTISYGEEKPADPGHNEAAWAKNRRVHFAEK